MVVYSYQFNSGPIIDILTFKKKSVLLISSGNPAYIKNITLVYKKCAEVSFIGVLKLK